MTAQQAGKKREEMSGTGEPIPSREPSALFKGRLGRRGVSFLRAQWRPLLLIGFILLVLVLFQAVLTPFILAFALAYVLHPAVQRLTRFQLRGAHLPVWISILIVYFVLIGSVMTLGSLAVPPVFAQLKILINKNVPEYAKKAREASGRLSADLKDMLKAWELHTETEAAETPVDGTTPERQDAPSGELKGRSADESVTFGPTDIVNELQKQLDRYQQQGIDWLKRMGSELPALVEGLAHSVFSFFLVLMLTFMFLVYFPTIFRFARQLIPAEYQDEFENIAREVNLRLAGVVRGQLLICLINGILTYLGFKMIGVNFASLLAFVAGVLSLIPIFGTIISTIPAALIGLTQSVMIAVLVVGWVIIIHILEAYILNPKIMGDSAHMNPLLIVFALLVGSQYFHPILGPLLAVPIAAIIQTVFLHFLTRGDRGDEERNEPARRESTASSV